MARKGIAPWANNAGQIGTPSLMWQQICGKEIYGDSLGGNLAKKTVAGIAAGSDGIDVTYASGTVQNVAVKSVLGLSVVDGQICVTYNA